MVGAPPQEAGQNAIRRQRMGSLRGCAKVIENLPRNLQLLDDGDLLAARHDRDERMSVLFRAWPSLSNLELRELKRLSDERQRLARHVGILRRLRALRAS